VGDILGAGQQGLGRREGGCGVRGAQMRGVKPWSRH